MHPVGCRARSAKKRAKCLGMRSSKEVWSPVSKMEWVRCNSCGYYPSSLTRLSIFLTSCGHLVCSKCLERAPTTDKPGCLQCRQPCKVVKLGPDSQPGPDVTFYFSDETSAIKKLLHAAQFQKMHYEQRAAMAKRKRLPWEIKEGERQEKEMIELVELLDKLTVPSANVLEGVREKARKAGIQPSLSQEFNCSRPNSPSCSPTPTVQQQLHPNNAQLQTPIMRPRQGYSFSPATKPIQPLNRSPAMQQRSDVASPLFIPLMSKCATQQQHNTIASPLSTPLMPRCATTMPGGADPRVTANLLTQSQLQNWSQSQQQRQQSPGVAVDTMMTPTQTVGPHHSIMNTTHHNIMASRPALGMQQLSIHPLNSVHSMHTNAVGSGGAVATQGVICRTRAVGRTTPLTMVPGSVLSQAASH